MKRSDELYKVLRPLAERLAGLHDEFNSLKLSCTKQNGMRKRTCRRCNGFGSYTGGYENGDIIECSRYEDYTGPCEARDGSGACAACLAAFSLNGFGHALNMLVEDQREIEHKMEREREMRQRDVERAKQLVKDKQAELAFAERRLQELTTEESTA